VAAEEAPLYPGADGAASTRRGVRAATGGGTLRCVRQSGDGMGRKTKARPRSRPRAPGEAVGAHGGRDRAAPTPGDWALRALALAGVLLTGYLAWAASTGTGAAFCGEGSGCDVVQGSAWSRFLGAPIALWGFGLHVLLAWAAWRPGSRVLRWRWLCRLSFLGLAISVYLTLAGWIALQAYCLWCLLSLALLAAIFVLVLLSRPEGAPGARPGAWWLANALLALAVVAALHVSASGLLERRGDPRLHALADHLARSGVQYYGASWCGNCREQSRQFGAAASRLPYVECSPHGRSGGVAFECVAAGISGYPTWVIGGRHYVEVIEPQRLAAMTGFDWEGARSE
jgi:uncharacterized membrane protein